MVNRLVILAGTTRRAMAIARRERVRPEHVAAPTRPSQLRGLGGLPVIFDHTAWDSPHADAFADYFAERADWLPPMVNR